jgi:hypothetical protein
MMIASCPGCGGSVRVPTEKRYRFAPLVCAECGALLEVDSLAPLRIVAVDEVWPSDSEDRRSAEGHPPGRRKEWKPDAEPRDRVARSAATHEPRRARRRGDSGGEMCRIESEKE